MNVLKIYTRCVQMITTTLIDNSTFIITNYDNFTMVKKELSLATLKTPVSLESKL